MIILDLRTIILILFFACIIIADIIIILLRLVKLFICRNIQSCKNSKCLFREICKKYDSHLTDEEYEELIQLVNSREKE